MKKLGVVIGRFQVPELHEGHKYLINSALEECGEILIIIGISPIINDRNPYNYEYIIKNIEKNYSNAHIDIVFDHNDNILWNKNLKNVIDIYSEETQPILYGSRDSFLKDYIGKYQTKYIEEIPGISGTQIREQLKNNKDV